MTIAPNASNTHRNQAGPLGQNGSWIQAFANAANDGAPPACSQAGK